VLNIHGQWKLEVNNKVLLQWFEGSWNEEAIIAYMREFKEIAQPLISGEWAILSIFEAWELGVPDIEPHIIEHCQWFKDNGCIKDCHVYSPSAVKKMLLEKLVPHTEENYERLVFSNINEATNWLKKCGFELHNSDFLLKYGILEK
jgi:hypothetical protein